jgi:hypothetical protein
MILHPILLFKLHLLRLAVIQRKSLASLAIRFALKVMRVVQLLASGFAGKVMARSHALEDMLAHRLIFAAIQRQNLARMATRIALMHVVRLLDSGFALLVGRSHVLEEVFAHPLLLHAAIH